MNSKRITDIINGINIKKNVMNIDTRDRETEEQRSLIE